MGRPEGVARLLPDRHSVAVVTYVRSVTLLLLNVMKAPWRVAKNLTASLSILQHSSVHWIESLFVLKKKTRLRYSKGHTPLTGLNIQIVTVHKYWSRTSKWSSKKIFKGKSKLITIKGGKRRIVINQVRCGSLRRQLTVPLFRCCVTDYLKGFTP